MGFEDSPVVENALTFRSLLAELRYNWRSLVQVGVDLLRPERPLTIVDK